MDATNAEGRSSAERWRAHCQQHPGRFLAVHGAAARRKRVETCEAQWINQLGQADVPLLAQAVAFRSIMDLRDCAARDVATFFGVEPQVIVAGISLLELPARPITRASSSPQAGQRKSKSRNSAA